MMNQIESLSQTGTGRQIDKSARGDAIALGVIQIQPDNNFKTLKKQSCMDGHSIYDCFKCLAIQYPAVSFKKACHMTNFCDIHYTMQPGILSR